MSSFVMTIDNDAPVDPVEPSIKNRKRYNDNYEVNNNSTVESSSSEEEDEDEDESEDEGTPESRTRFVFQDDDSEEEEDYYEAAQTSTWDFKGAISKIKKEDKRLHGQNHMSTVDDKIKKLLSKRVNQNIKVEENKRSDDSSENSNKNLDDSSDNEKSNIDSSNSNEDSNDSDSPDNDEVNSDGSEEFEKPVVIINDQYDDMKARRKALRGSSTTKNNDSFFDDEESARIEAEEARIQAVGTRKKTKKKDTTTTTTTSPYSSTSVTFDALNLSRPLLRAVKSLNFKRPTPIQARAIPLALAGRDLCCNAMTGSGKIFFSFLLI
jgi:ATP-dependent RNA helicase DDX27